MPASEPGQREELIRALFDDYRDAYVSRDERIFELFSEEFSGFAGGCHSLTSTRDDWLELTRRDFAQVPGPIRHRVDDLVVQDLSDDVFMVTAVVELEVPLSAGESRRFRVRYVQVRRREDGDWKIVHSSTSSPIERGGDEVYPLRALEARNRALEALVEQRTLSLEQANRELVELSRVDGLTGIANRRRLDELLEHEWSRARRSASPLAVVMVDIDWFKDYNDRNGHLAGDDCLRAVAAVLQHSMARRGTDLVARFGGEEFAVLLPGTDRDVALDLAQQFRRDLRVAALPHEGSRWEVVTTSIGVASIVPTADSDPEILLAQADAALYRAKEQGRNQVEPAVT
ncbi:MAG: diguanylate cyclase [Acidimicrobiales bacterium]